MSKIKFVYAGPARVISLTKQAVRVALIDLGGEVKWIPKSVMSTPTRTACEQAKGDQLVPMRVKDWFFEKEL